MKVSVIMRLHNCEDTLRTSLDSLLNQTFQCFEMILCDDASTDATYDIASEYQQMYPSKITLIRNETNRGMSYSLNRSFNVASGEYIARMDAENVARSDRLKRQITFLEKNENIDLVGSNVALFDEGGVWGVRKSLPYPGSKDFLSTSPFISSTVVLRRNLFEHVNGYMQQNGPTVSKDYELFMHLYALGFTGANIQELLVFLRLKRRKSKTVAYKYRLNEAKVRQKGFKELSLLPTGYVYVIKPLIVGLFPQRFLQWIRGEDIH